jgi:hypothetical protein
MKKNMGARDRITRILIATLIVSLYFLHVLTGHTALVFLLGAFVFTITGISGFCPLYLPLRIHTNQNQTNDTRN